MGIALQLATLFSFSFRLARWQRATRIAGPVRRQQIVAKTPLVCSHRMVATSPVALVSGERYSTGTGFADMCCECVARTGPGVFSATPSDTLNPHS